MAELEKDEIVVEDKLEDLYRQVHPNFFDNGSITSQVFEENSSDEGMLSASRSSIISAEEATRGYVESGRGTLGAVTLTVSEWNAEGIQVIDDSAARTVPKGHAYADVREAPMTKGKARRLKILARDRWAWKVSSVASSG